jgi:hypothetical protein
MITPHDKCPECQSDLQKDLGEPHPLGEWFKGVPSPDEAIKSAQNDLKYL